MLFARSFPMSLPDPAEGIALSAPPRIDIEMAPAHAQLHPFPAPAGRSGPAVS